MLGIVVIFRNTNTYRRPESGVRAVASHKLPRLLCSALFLLNHLRKRKEGTVHSEITKPARKDVDNREGLEHIRSTVRSDSSDDYWVAGYTRRSAEEEARRKQAAGTRRKAESQWAFEDSGYTTRQRRFAAQEEEAMKLPHRSRRKGEADGRLKPVSSSSYHTINSKSTRSQDRSRRMSPEGVHGESDYDSLYGESGTPEPDRESRRGRLRQLSNGDPASYDCGEK